MCVCHLSLEEEEQARTQAILSAERDGLVLDGGGRIDEVDVLVLLERGGFPLLYALEAADRVDELLRRGVDGDAVRDEAQRDRGVHRVRDAELGPEEERPAELVVTFRPDRLRAADLGLARRRQGLCRRLVGAAHVERELLADGEEARVHLHRNRPRERARRRVVRVSDGALAKALDEVLGHRGGIPHGERAVVQHRDAPRGTVRADRRVPGLREERDALGREFEALRFGEEQVPAQRPRRVRAVPDDQLELAGGRRRRH
mmetsp:Transcript_7568/g.31326  ORF Transcript_7568/g.31326 Transcript_7568/m.31326 type:complete len:260 (-) Transcript_7568:80-859(-)|eukprot:CAMPEP_0185700990 /NCGR_PEP_ID=MMETSP1164-20130828/8241_1 /TAXON_ID=1104430 /ORGANISM="Chrysoreinhardia sp, Strain CCMP2950" /LENGTH=259 /DNA_ID=CAMNT_0028367963 /DNA_START=219 /DNA_END=998 /DNA_ORIENTATION=-